jgi:N-acetylmuramoyl-L-alanine amidase
MRTPLVGVPLEDQPEEIVSRMGVWGEARGESAKGKAAVWWVVRNRAVRADTSIREQWLRPLQFSCFNANDPNRSAMLQAHSNSPAAWAACDAVCELCEAGLLDDPTHGATHYYRPDVCSPVWGRGHDGWHETAVIGHHVFGRAT